MRFRLLGQPIALPMAVLAVLEAAIFGAVLIAVVRLRLGLELQLSGRTNWHCGRAR